ncbi:gfo/Idh/MocA family oxidoreductase [candidate division KSB1 bacterium]|nr:gfo/Idh/MocA family oxidoreductase [candidate division KSB1 bacterium]
MTERKRYAIVGLGSRSEMYRDAILETHRESCELVGLCDNNSGRLTDSVDWVANQGTSVPGFDAADFEKMIAETTPDCVIVTTKDSLHDHYICRAMELGCDTITEKPMTTDEVKCKRILDIQRKTGRQCKVTFNYRYSPPRAQVKDLLMSGVIGNIISVDFHWLLDTEHGADYFRRWHRNKENSGGLLVHKATHHFDLVNWWLSTIPASVFALGNRLFYTPQTGERYGLLERGERCNTCREKRRCPFVLDMESLQSLNRLYLKNEHFDGYIRDKCVFSPGIDIEDSISATVRYQNNAMLSYSLNAFAPWEGYIVTFNGTKGRLEHKCEEQVYVSGDETIPGALKKEGTWIKIFPHFKPAYEVDIWGGEGGHGGGDPIMLRDIFEPDSVDDKYMRAADHRAGAYSILCGIAANRSIESGKLIHIADLVPNLQKPEFTRMPGIEEPLPLIKSKAKPWLHL